MASTYWIKLYYEILDDPKMGRLPDHIWRRSVEFFLMAGEAGNGGYLPSVQDIAWRLRTNDADVLECLEALRAVNVTDVTPDGEWIVTHFAVRQDATSNAERQQRYRERKHKSNADSNEPRNDNVTERNADKEEDKDKDKKKKASPPAPISGDWYIRVFSQVTGMMAFPGGETDKIIPALDGLYAEYNGDESALIDYLKPYWAYWLTRKAKNGRAYSRTNCAWLYDLAVAHAPLDNKPAGEPHYAEVF